MPQCERCGQPATWRIRSVRLAKWFAAPQYDQWLVGYSCDRCRLQVWRDMDAMLGLFERDLARPKYSLFSLPLGIRLKQTAA